MRLEFDLSLISGYTSHSQIARILTEDWVAQNMFCPRCGQIHIQHFENNRPVADFYCPNCHNEFELKSKNGQFGKKVNDGAYDTMIQRIESNTNPDFFLLNYSKEKQCVKDFMFIPKHFFVPGIIEKRKPLSEHARRAGWVGCNILIENIPVQGRVAIVKDGSICDVQTVLAQVNQGKRLEVSDLHARGWLLDVLHCINSIPTTDFSLAEVYLFTDILSAKHPKNYNVQAKIRQQLQLLRDLGFVEFIARGKYRKV